MNDIEERKLEVSRLADLISLPAEMRPQFEMDPDAEAGDYIVNERGEWLFIRAEPFGQGVGIQTESFDELLYCVFKALTHDLAESRARSSYVMDTEARRFIWPRQLEMMGTLSPAWRSRLEQEILSILDKSPAKDGKGDIAQQLGITKQ